MIVSNLRGMRNPKSANPESANHMINRIINSHELTLETDEDFNAVIGCDDLFVIFILGKFGQKHG